MGPKDPPWPCCVKGVPHISCGMMCGHIEEAEIELVFFDLMAGERLKAQLTKNTQNFAKGLGRRVKPSRGRTPAGKSDVDHTIGQVGFKSVVFENKKGGIEGGLELFFYRIGLLAIFAPLRRGDFRDVFEGLGDFAGFAKPSVLPGTQRSFVLCKTKLFGSLTQECVQGVSHEVWWAISGPRGGA